MKKNDQEINLKVAGYTILREIGSGGMAMVYQARDDKLKRTVAIKVLHAHLCKEDPSATKRFEREARAAAAMDHPNIVRIFDLISENNNNFIVMEYVPGTDMQSVLKSRERIEPGIVIAIMREIASALAEAHSLGIMHRDLKPANILVHRQQRRAMLSDFGLAFQQTDNRLTLTNSVAGSPTFMSPEQISGIELTNASDVYSWGVTFYNLLTGRFPYRAQKFPEVIPEIQAGRLVVDPGLITELPSCYYELLMCCLVTTPDKRIQDGTRLKERLEKCCSTHPVPADLATIFADRMTSTPAHPEETIAKTNIFNPKGSITPDKRNSGRFPAIVGVALAAVLLGSAAALFLTRHFFTAPRDPILMHVASRRLPPLTPTAVLPEPRNASPAKELMGHLLKPGAAALKAPAPVNREETLPPKLLQSQPAALDSGQLFVFSEPYADTVWIDGKAIGGTPMEKPVSLPQGDHGIKLFNKHCKLLEDNVTITAGKIVRKRYTLQLLQ